MSETFDRIYIGSGPINLVDAYLRSKAGERIAIIDSKLQAGGAWVAIPVGEYGRLEIGCHIWSYNKKVYNFLKDLLDLHLVDQKPQPYFLNGNSKMIYDHKNLLLAPKNVMKQVFKGQFKSAFNYATKHPSSRLPIIPKTYQYPKGGAREFQHKLEELIHKSDAEIMLNNEVQEVNYADGEWTIIGQEGSSLKARNVVMTATSHMKSVSYNDVKVDLNYDFINYTHFHIVVSGDIHKPISYVRVLNNDHIHRVSDITNQLPHERLNETVLLVGVFDDKIAEWGSEIQAADKIMEYLIDKGFLDKTNKLVYFQKNRFPTSYIHEDQRDIIRNFDPSIELIATTDLIYGFYWRIQDWKKQGLI